MSDIQVSTISEGMSVKYPGFFKRLLWVFTSPGKLMASLAEKPKVLFVLILAAIPTDLLYLLRMPLYKDMLRKAAIAQSNSSYLQSLGVEMTPEMVEATLPRAVTTGLISTPVTIVIVMLVVALLFFGVFKIMGGQGKYKAYLSVVGHANIITVLYTLLLIPISYITGTLSLEAPLTSLATLVSQDSVGSVLYGVLSNIDLFTIWYYVVMAIGFTAVTKLKKKNVYIVVAGAFLIGMIISMVSQQAAGALMQ